MVIIKFNQKTGQNLLLLFFIAFLIVIFPFFSLIISLVELIKLICETVESQAKKTAKPMIINTTNIKSHNVFGSVFRSSKKLIQALLEKIPVSRNILKLVSFLILGPGLMILEATLSSAEKLTREAKNPKNHKILFFQEIFQACFRVFRYDSINF